MALTQYPLYELANQGIGLRGFNTGGQYLVQVIITVGVLPHVTTLLVLSLAHQVTARLTALFLPSRVKHCAAQKPNTALDLSKRS